MAFLIAPLIIVLIAGWVGVDARARTGWPAAIGWGALNVVLPGVALLAYLMMRPARGCASAAS